MSKKKKLGSDPLGFIKDTREEDTVINEKINSGSDASQFSVDASVTLPSNELIETSYVNVDIKRQNNEEIIYALNGDMNIYSVKELKDIILQSFTNEKKIVFDLQMINKFDTAGYQFLLLCKNDLEKKNAEIVFSNPSASIARIFELYNDIL